MGTHTPGRATGQCKGPEAGTHLACLGNNEEASVVGQEGARGK